MADPDLAPESVLAVLNEHGVKFVLIGGFAAVIHGSPYLTTDVDVVPEWTKENLERLSAALDELHARIWTAGAQAGESFEHDATFLGNANMWNLVTDHGRLDITFVPSGTTGYEDLARDSEHLEILGVDVDVAALADVIRSKEAAGREKDRVVLPVLRRILDEERRASNRSSEDLGHVSDQVDQRHSAHDRQGGPAEPHDRGGPPQRPDLGRESDRHE